MERRVIRDDPLTSAARTYVLARIAHEGAARSALLRVVAEVAAVQSGEAPPEADDGWTDREKMAPDGIRLTVRCEMGDGVVRWRWRMRTSVALERAEQALERATEAGGDAPDLRAAVQTLLTELAAPLCASYRVDAKGRPVDAAEKARADAAIQHHGDVFQRLCEAVERRAP